MRRLLVLAVVALVGCGPGLEGPVGPVGPEGEPGPVGPQGPPGPSGGSVEVLTWVDASGVVVGRQDSPSWVDAAGHVWTLDPETARIDDAVHVLPRVYFAGPSCLGTAYLEARLPNVPWQQLGEGAFRLRSAAVLSAPLSYVRVMDIEAGGTCVALSGTIDAAVPMFPLQPSNIAPPPLSFTAPLHQEMRPE